MNLCAKKKKQKKKKAPLSPLRIYFFISLLGLALGRSAHQAPLFVLIVLYYSSQASPVYIIMPLNTVPVQVHDK